MLIGSKEVIPGLYRLWNVDANEHFFAKNVEEVLKPKNLYTFVNSHLNSQVERLETLESYYKAENTGIFNGERRLNDYTDNKADYRAAHNFAKFISRFISGYMTGVPIAMTHPDEKTQESIKIFNEENEADAINSALALDLSIFGRAYEIMYTVDGKNKVSKLDVKNTFVVYDLSINKKPLAAIRYFTNYDTEQKKRMLYVTVYTDNKIYEIELNGDQVEHQEEQTHLYKRVPVVEYSNDEFRQGDFENVITLIDLYDAAQSDTANYMKDTNDAVLVIIGGADLSGDDAIKWRKANMVHIQPNELGSGAEGKADAKYIYKQYDVGGMEAYKKRLERDIHKFTNTPNMHDENFGGAESGVAIELKLTGLAQDRAIKERLFKAGLKDRYRMHFTVDNIITSNANDAEKIEFRFTPNLPKDVKGDLQAFVNAGGVMSQKTLYAIFSSSFGTDYEQEAENLAIEAENNAASLSQASSYQNDFTS